MLVEIKAKGNNSWVKMAAARVVNGVHWYSIHECMDAYMYIMMYQEYTFIECSSYYYQDLHNYPGSLCFQFHASNFMLGRGCGRYLLRLATVLIFHGAPDHHFLP